MIYITNLLKICDTICLLMENLVREESVNGICLDDQNKDVSSLQTLILNQVESVDAICKKHQTTPEELPVPSFRAYRWLKYLNESSHLVEHLQTLKTAYQFTVANDFSKKIRPAIQRLPLRIVFLNQSSLYRVRQSRQGIELFIHEGFCGAPPEMIEDILSSALIKRYAVRLTRIRQYARGSKFMEVDAQLDGNKRKKVLNPRGQAYDLELIFHRVNSEYFQGNLERPGLTWSKVLTFRTFGHYHLEQDTVTISRTLDNNHVPPYVVDYIMYHELLHKKLGVKISGKRKLAHTTEFRKLEQSFVQYADAKIFLHGLAKKSPPRRRRRV